MEGPHISLIRFLVILSMISDFGFGKRRPQRENEQGGRWGLAEGGTPRALERASPLAIFSLVVVLKLVFHLEGKSPLTPFENNAEDSSRGEFH